MYGVVFSEINKSVGLDKILEEGFFSHLNWQNHILGGKISKIDERLKILFMVSVFQCLKFCLL